MANRSEESHFKSRWFKARGPCGGGDSEKNLMVNSRSDSGSDSFVLAKAKKPVYEASMSKESDKTQELSCVVQVQEKVHTLASQTAVKAKDFTAETKSTLSVDAEELKYHQVQQPRVTKRKTAIECQSKPINMKLQKVKLVKVKLRRWRGRGSKDKHFHLKFNETAVDRWDTEAKNREWELKAITLSKASAWFFKYLLQLCLLT